MKKTIYITLIILVLFVILNLFTAFLPMIFIIGAVEPYYNKVVKIFVPNQYYIDKMETNKRQVAEEQNKKYGHLTTKKLFDTIDTDSSGKISKNEYTIYVSKQIEEEERGKLESLVRECDTNNDGKIELDEALTPMRKGDCKLSMKDFIYSDLDKNSNTISMEELKYIHQKNLKSKSKNILTQMSFSDKNRDEEFDFDEFQNRIHYGATM